MNTWSTIRKLTATLTLLSALAATASSTDPQEDLASPFKVDPLVKIQGNQRTLEIQFSCPPEHHLYADELSFELNGAAIHVSLPKPVEIPDRFGDGVKETFANTFSANYPLEQSTEPLELVVNLRGCNHDECYFPESRNFKITSDNHVVAITETDTTETIAATSNSTGTTPVAPSPAGNPAGSTKLPASLNPPTHPNPSGSTTSSSATDSTAAPPTSNSVSSTSPEKITGSTPSTSSPICPTNVPTPPPSGSTSNPKHPHAGIPTRSPTHPKTSPETRPTPHRNPQDKSPAPSHPRLRLQ